MANYNAKYRVKNASGDYDTIYLETTAEQVKLNDGSSTVQQKINQLEKSVDLQERASMVYNSNSDSIDFIFN